MVHSPYILLEVVRFPCVFSSPSDPAGFIADLMVHVRARGRCAVVRAVEDVRVLVPAPAKSRAMIMSTVHVPLIDSQACA